MISLDGAFAAAVAMGSRQESPILCSYCYNESVFFVEKTTIHNSFMAAAVV